MAVVAFATAVLVASPAAGRIPRVRTVVLEPELGAALPAVGFVTGTAGADFGTGAVPYADALEPAFLGGLHLAWLFPVGDEDGRCLLGPETGVDYLVWNPDVPLPDDPYTYADENLEGGRARILAGGRLAGLWNWGWLLARLGLGPEVAAGWEEELGSEPDGDVGAFLQVGFGLGVDLVDWLVVSLLADVVLTFHTHEAEGEDYVGELYFGYRSLEFNLAVGFSFLL